MPTKIYDIKEVELIDGTLIEISPLKIKYLRQFMDEFQTIKNSKDDDESISILVECVRIAMKQYFPELKTTEDIEDSLALQTIYEILDVAAGIKMNPEQTETNKRANDSSNSWDNLDLAKLESEIFILGIWKNYDELESSVSMPEIMAILESRRELDYNEKKFLAAMQGVDLDEASGKQEEDPWEAMKARVESKISGIGNGDSTDILSFQGQKAAQHGFGIGMGLDYEVVSD